MREGASSRRRPVLFQSTRPSTPVSSDTPDRRELRPGMTVRVVQDAENNDGEPLVGDIQTILDDDAPDSRGVKVKLHSDVTGRVQEVVTPAEEDELTE